MQLLIVVRINLHPTLNQALSGNIYDIRRKGFIGFLILSVAVVGIFLFYSDSLVKDLSEQERERMQIWADATREIVNAGNGDSDVLPSNFDFLLSIIERNRTIPVLLTDDDGHIIMQRNFTLPEPEDSAAIFGLSDANRRFLSLISTWVPQEVSISTTKIQKC